MVLSGAGAHQLFVPVLLLCAGDQLHPHPLRDQKGFSLLPGKSLITNFQNVLADANIPVITGIRNSLIVSACSAAFSVYLLGPDGLRHLRL